MSRYVLDHHLQGEKKRLVTELRGDLVQFGELTEALIDTFFAACADPNWWTQTIAFTAVQGRAPALEPRTR